MILMILCILMISERTILWYMTFWGFGMNFMLRMNLNIAIVSMVRHAIRDNNYELKTELLKNNSSTNTSAFINTKIENVSTIF